MQHLMDVSQLHTYSAHSSHLQDALSGEVERRAALLVAVNPVTQPLQSSRWQHTAAATAAAG
jgi:hypothetical protein